MTLQHASYSALTSYTRCGEQFRLRRMAGKIEHPSWWLTGGSTFHQITEKWDLLGEDEPVWDEDRMIRPIWEQVWRENLPDVEGTRFEGVEPRAAGGRKPQDDVWWEINGPKMVSDYMAWRKASGWVPMMHHWETTAYQTPAVEVTAHAALDGVWVKAFVDRIFVTPDGEAVIVDLKTGSRAPDSALQLGFYKVLLKERYDIDIDLGAYYMSRKGDITEPQRLDKYTPEYVSRMVVPFMDAVDKNLFLPNPGMACATCGVAYACWVVGGDDADV